MNNEINLDPLGIYSLQKELLETRAQLQKMETVLNGVELPVSEKKIIERTGIKKGTLLSLRQTGQIRFYKAGAVVTYIPSEFTEDIRKLTPNA